MNLIQYDKMKGGLEPLKNIMSGKWHKFYRENVLKMSQTTFCDITGVKQPNLSRHETGLINKTITDHYEDMGFEVFVKCLNPDEIDFINKILDGRMLKYINGKKPGCAPIPLEVNKNGET